MAINVFYPTCRLLAYAPVSAAGKSIQCPGCKHPIPVPRPPAGEQSGEQPTEIPCPQCQNRLRLIRDLDGQRVRCNHCRAMLLVSAEPWHMSLVGSLSKVAAAIAPLGVNSADCGSKCAGRSCMRIATAPFCSLQRTQNLILSVPGELVSPPLRPVSSRVKRRFATCGSSPLAKQAMRSCTLNTSSDIHNTL